MGEKPTNLEFCNLQIYPSEVREKYFLSQTKIGISYQWTCLVRNVKKKFFKEKENTGLKLRSTYRKEEH